jgi:hypothetical protein
MFEYMTDSSVYFRILLAAFFVGQSSPIPYSGYNQAMLNASDLGLIQTEPRN